ncbi:MAG: hypothetical protein RMI56_01020 [Sulfolobales archaeon]|nr:hypothetical protein [Sulfolobales archaeon]
MRNYLRYLAVSFLMILGFLLTLSSDWTLRVLQIFSLVVSVAILWALSSRGL